ncbi:hypothetical protein O7599_22675 [Streptomyces sp. WMMC500]|nr:SapB/AmfS family lanthipeptide [Streptomyces sp. WMMC500]WBB58432.1 hypothetical protein O7599_22675 [Streptomyces sp. WMMC500]
MQFVLGLQANEVDATAGNDAPAAPSTLSPSLCFSGASAVLC